MTPEEAQPQPPLDANAVRVGAGFDFTDPNSPLAPLYLRSVQIVAALVVVLVFVLCSYFPLWHTDVWGHLKYGEWMIQNQQIPDHEPFSPWWDGRQKFTQFYTLTQLTMYWSYLLGARLAGGDEVQQMAGGVEMLRALHGLLTAARFLALLIAIVRLSGSWGMGVLGMVMMIGLDLSNLVVFRPQTFAQVFFAVLLIPLSRGMLSRRSLVLIPLMHVVWANSHGSYIVGLVMLGLALVGRAWDTYMTTGIRPWADLGTKRLVIALIASALGIALLNPYGPEFYLRTFELTQHPSLTGGIGEWKPLVFEWARGWHWVFMISVLVVIGTHATSRKSLPTDQLLMIFAFGIGASLQTRFVIWWAILLPWVLVPRWFEMLQDYRGPQTGEAEKPSFRKTLLGLLAGWAVLMWCGLAAWLTQGSPQTVELAVSSGTPWQIAHQLRNPTLPEAQHYPALTKILQERYPEGKFLGTIMATPMQGDYLLWALAPQIPVTYAHIHLFPPDYWDEIGIVGQGRPGWWEILDKYQVNLIVVEAEFSQKLRDELLRSPGWEIIVDETNQTDKKPNDLTRQLIAVRREPRR